MDTLILTENYKMLPESLESLHHQSIEWKSDLEFWKIEIAFLEKMLEQNALKFKESEAKAKLESLQNKIFYYKYELLDELRHEVKDHEKYLVQLLTTKEPYNYQDYRTQHLIIYNKIVAVKKEIQNLKHMLFQMIEKVIL